MLFVGQALVYNEYRSSLLGSFDKTILNIDMHAIIKINILNINCMLCSVFSHVGDDDYKGV